MSEFHLAYLGPLFRLETPKSKRELREKWRSLSGSLICLQISVLALKSK